MLYFYFSKIRENPVIKTLNKFIYSPWYMVFVSMIMVASNVFGLEFFAFYAYTLIGLYVCLFADDCFPLAPMFCCGYMLFSADNNPAVNHGETIFSSEGNIVQLIVIVLFIIIMLTTRFLFELIVVRRKQKKLPALTFGFIALGAAYLLSGIFTPGYGGKELAYAALQIVSLCITYFFFFYTVNWEKRKLSDGAAMLSAIGFGLFLEIAGMYLNPRVLALIQSGAFERGDLLSGWGVYNNVGGMMAMLVPAPFYFACTKKNGWLYLLLATLFLGGVFLTQSRASILTGGMIYGLCCIFAVIYTPRGRRKFYVLVLFGFVGLALFAGAILLLKVDITMLESLFQEGSKDNGRMEIYKSGIEQFLSKPIFGKGFYAPIEDKHIYDIFTHQYGWEHIGDDFFIPPRYHNTVVQLLATGGIVAIAAYLFHRVQTILLFFIKPAAHKTFLGLSVLALLIASLLDCHFFNIGPGLTYGLILLCAEMLPYKKKEKAQPLKQR